MSYKIVTHSCLVPKKKKKTLQTNMKKKKSTMFHISYLVTGEASELLNSVCGAVGVENDAFNDLSLISHFTQL
jgi:hypothetical protein